MAGRPRQTTRSAKRRALACSIALYRLFLYAYPATFRKGFGVRMSRVFADHCRVTLQESGLPALIPLWFSTLSDVVLSASSERWRTYKEKVGTMASVRDTRQLPPRLWIAVAATLIAFLVCLVASLNLYLLEEGSPLTAAAYSASPLLRFSYDGVYLSALAAGVAVCGIAGYALVPRPLLILAGLTLLALLVALGGFGGLLTRHPVSFLVLFAVFLGLTLGSFLLGWLVKARGGESLGARPSAVLGSCVGAGGLLLINVAALSLHTLSLNPVSHTLYMQGQMGGTHLNFMLLILGLSLFTLVACMVCLGRALGLLAPPA
ncbi:MAG: hypothetical protein C5B60_01435 [Chloroflexi bacterium]|nr:MAG: hypothetical protein C5B60_01435 [Chloroflexota bacterium]